ncbi:hypothetical protein [Chitinophaga silvatica]|uniref:hypothetical protein n=1 Tax=Chitinophaga silvatica TaxID=2282649 RepID=UPI0011C0DE92|nr:hypothetical protein [Chitinophaga silvatica]
MKLIFLLLLVTLISGVSVFAQVLSLGSKNATDTGYLYLYNGSKIRSRIPIALYSKSDSVDVIAVRAPVRKIQPAPTPVHTPFLVIHGNVMYDYFYQSNIDTPYVEKDIQQHTVQTNLSITVRNRYPLRVAFSTQQGNSALFRNLTGARLSYNNNDFKNQLILNARNWVIGNVKQQRLIDSLKNLADSLQREIHFLKYSYGNTPYLQRLVEARELAFKLRLDSIAGKYKGKVSTDSLYKKIMVDKELELKRIDSMQLVLDKLKKSYQLVIDKQNRIKSGLLDALQHSRNNKELSDALERLNLPDTVLPKGFKTLLAIRSFGIGRTIADYSELTAKNISISGVQIEYNPSYYLAVATGTVDYQFRNFIVKEKRNPQYLSLIRGGVGMKESNHLYFTYYTGKKQLYGGNAVVDTGAVADNHLMGIALETQLKLGEQTFLTGEVARSSMPYNSRKVHGENNLSSMMNFSRRSNEAYTIGFNTVISKVYTRLSAMYKLMGNDFQSFSFYTTGSRQIAWNIQGEQPFFKQKILLAGAIRKNDYATFYTPSNYQSNTLFKSIQLTVRVPKYPIVSLAYQPTSQLMKLGEGEFSEQVFYMLSGTATYTYTYKGIMMNSMLSYSRFYNRQTDTAFVYFNSKNLMAGHTLFLKRFTIAGQASAALTENYSVHGLTGETTWKMFDWLEVGGALKYNHQSQTNNIQWGYCGNSRINVKRIGEIAIRVDKSYLPGPERKLVSNNTGRLTYTRIF